MILAALFAVAVTAAPCESLVFDLPLAYDAGPSPAAAVAADFDGDGNLDLLAGGVDGLTFLRGDGRGRFTSRRTMPGLPVTDLFVFGRTAIAYDARTGTATSLTYAAGDFKKVASITGSGALSYGDFNGDHELDMLFPSMNVRATGDVDGDGRDELVLLSGSTLTFLRVEGSSFVTAGTLQVSTPLPQDVVVADFDGDGRKDVGIRSSGIPLLDVYRSRGGFAFDPSISSHYERGAFRVVDVDADHKPDLIAEGERFAVFQRGRGDGSFEAEQPVGRIFTGQGSGKRGVLAVADFDRDGVPDLASLAPNGVLLAHGNGDGSFGDRRYLPVDDVLKLADFDGDGRIDVLGSDGASTYVALRQPDGTYRRVAAADPKDPIPSTTQRELVAAADINGDHKLDLVFANPGNAGGITRWLGNGDGTFRRVAQVISVGTDPRSLTLTDVNADGFLDVVIGNGAGSAFAFTYALGDPDGGYGDPHSLLPKADSGDAGFVTDINGDGYPDLVTAGAFGITMTLDDDAGSFGTPITFPFEQQIASIVAIADIDGDRKADLIYDDYHRLIIRSGYGDGTFGGAIPLPLGNLANAYTIADVNGDGLADLIGSHDASTEIVLNRGALIFAAPQSWPVVGEWTGEWSVVDTDGDRLPDLVGEDGLVVRAVCPVVHLPRRRTAGH